MGLIMGFLMVCFYSLVFIVCMVALGTIIGGLADHWVAVLVVAIIVAIIVVWANKKPTPSGP